MKQVQFSVSRFFPSLQQHLFLFRTEWTEFNIEDIERTLLEKFPKSQDFHIQKNTRTLTHAYESL